MYRKVRKDTTNAVIIQTFSTEMYCASRISYIDANQHLINSCTVSQRLQTGILLIKEVFQVSSLLCGYSYDFSKRPVRHINTFKVRFSRFLLSSVGTP